VTKVFAFTLPVGYESLNVDDDAPGDAIGTWETPGLAAVLSYVGYLPESVANRIRAMTRCYRIDRDIENGEAFWMNHCEHCEAQIKEEELHGELDGPFGHEPYLGLEAIQLHEVREPFEALAGAESHDVKLLDS
jgi:hypothetical protein